MHAEDCSARRATYHGKAAFIYLRAAFQREFQTAVQEEKEHAIDVSVAVGVHRETHAKRIRFEMCGAFAEMTPREARASASGLATLGEPSHATRALVALLLEGAEISDRLVSPTLH